MGAPKGRIPWNKGLTIQSDERVRKNAISTKISCNKKEYKKKLSGRIKKIWESFSKEERSSIVKNRIKSRRSYKGEGNPQFGKHSNKGQTKETHEWRRISASKNVGENNGMFRNVRKFYYSYIGFRKDLGHICRSTWEANFARILNYEGIKYEYESRTFILSNNKTYTPDFFIPSQNIYYEIKGNLTEESLWKIRDVYTKYNTQIVMIGPEQYENLKKQYIHLINKWEEGTIELRKKIENIKFIESEIIEIKKSHYKPKRVYNLSLEGDDCFIANGMVVHNTKAHIIEPKDKKALRFEVGKKQRLESGKGNANFVFAKKVHHPGTKAQAFMRPAFDSNVDRIKKIFASHINKVR